MRKFASTQFTLVGNLEQDGKVSEVYLDVTCIQHPVHFDRFKKRQDAFRQVFSDMRARMEAYHDMQGALAFDAYMHLLKAFAAKVRGNALTGFQATCIGLYTLQIGHYRLNSSQSIALSLFEGFLNFCGSFFGDVQPPLVSYRTCAIDLSCGGRWLPRQSPCWRSELYFMECEEKLMIDAEERMNVAHSLDPVTVSVAARALLVPCASSDHTCSAGWVY